MSIILIILVLCLCFGGLPNTWGYNRAGAYGYWPSGGLGLVLLILIVLALTGRF